MAPVGWQTAPRLSKPAPMTVCGASKRSRGLVGLAVPALICGLALAGCEDDAGSGKKEDPKADAGTAPPGMDPKLAAAVKSAAVTEAPSDDGPPPNGVFADGAADEAHAPGAPVEITLIDKGAEPREVIRPQLDMAKGGTMKVVMSRAIPGGVLPPVIFTLAVRTGEIEEGAEPDSRPITFTVKSAKPGELQPGQQNAPDIDKMLETLVGTKIETTVSKRGELGQEKLVAGEKVKSPMDLFAAGLSDVLGLFFSPMPADPVGVGASWIAHDRTQFAGMNVVRYRVTKLEKKDGDQMAFSVDVRMYAIDDEQQPDIAQGEAVLMAFQATGKGAYTVAGGSLLPTSGQLQVPVVAQLASPKQPQRVIPLQFETKVAIEPAKAP